MTNGLDILRNEIIVLALKTALIHGKCLKGGILLLLFLISLFIYLFFSGKKELFF